MSQEITYEILKSMFDVSQQICDPIDYEYRQKFLLTYVVRYILERDRPKEKENTEQINCN